MQSASVFALPSIVTADGDRDGIPNVILEAMATGLPIVATSVSGIPLAVSDGLNGRLVAENDAGALLAALDELLASPEKRQRMGRASRERAEKDHTWATISGRYRAAYCAHIPGLDD